MNRIGRVRTALFGLGIAGVLGFGASQALAAPGQPAYGLSCYPECYEQCGPEMGTKLTEDFCICCG